MLYTVAHFYYKYFDLIVDESFKKKKSTLFGSKSKKIERIKETDEQLWNRINDVINEYATTIISIETIWSCTITVGGESQTKTNIHNNNTIGYKIFYVQRSK